MKLFRNRTFAVLIMIAAIAGAIFGGMGRSLDNLAKKTEDTYYSANDGYGDIKDYFDSSQNCANLLYKLAEKNGIDSTTLGNYKKVIDYTNDAKTPGDKYSAGKKLVTETDTFYNAVKASQKLDGTDTDTAVRLYTEIVGNAKRVENVTSIRRDNYNEQADSFNKNVLSQFPANFFADLYGIEKFELIY